MSNTTLLLEIATANLEGTERRLGQESMAESVASAIETGRHLVVQAGTGTGKTLGYLVPVLASGKRTVIATVTKALQDQLASKDLPHACAALAPHLERAPTWAVLKGRSNYLCLQRLDELANENQLELADLDRSHLANLRAWAEQNAGGDLDSYPGRLTSAQRGSVTVTADECPGASRCARGAECFTERARRIAQEADVVVVNTHLYGLHLMTEGQLLPEHEVVVLDEAHQLEDVISDVASITLSPRRLQTLANTIGAVVADDHLKSTLFRAADTMSAALSPLLERRIEIGSQLMLADALHAARAAAASALDAVSRAQEGRSIDDEGIRQKLLRATIETTRVIDNIDRFLGCVESEVLFVEGTNDRPVLTLSPLDVGQLLRQRLWSQSVSVLTSATVPRNLMGRLGLDESDVSMVDVGSPFRYDEQGVLYCPATIAEPRSSSRDDEVAREIEQLVRIAGGRTLALFTTVRAMRQHAAEMEKRLPYRILVQDDMPRAALVEAFSADETSCLFATAGFFQGVDIPGPTLSLVIIDKIPFPRPDDPLLEARRLAIGKTSFAEIDIPRAATMLAQAAGRLIRSSHDCGVVAVLDPRLASKPYGRELVAALPPFKRTTKIDEVRDFFAQTLT